MAKDQKVTRDTVSAGGGERVLIVEDDPDVRNFAVMLVEGFGYEVHEASNAEAALTMLEALDGVDLVLTDMVLSAGMNGGELADSVRQSDPNVTIVYMSGYAADALARAGEVPAGDELVEKPFRQDAMAAAFRRALDRRAAIGSRAAKSEAGATI